MTESKDEREEKLGSGSIPRLIVSLAIPAIIAQFINVLYNIVDRVYIGHIEEAGDLALTGLGVAFPIVMLVSAFSAFAGAGGAPLSAIAMGKKDHERAERILGNAAVMLIFFSVVLTIVFSIWKEPLLYLFGASENTVAYAMDYLGIYLLGTVFVQAALGLNMFITSQGFAKTAMASVLIGAVLNIILDPVFIFVFELGVKGAAIATVISQACSAAWVVGFLISKKSSLRIQLCNLKPDMRIIGSIAALGVSPFIMQSTESLITIVLNRGLQQYGGDLYVGSLTIMQSVMQLVVVPVQGLTQGVQPIISYNYGARNVERIKKTFKIVLITTLAVTITSCVLTMTIPEVFAAIFTDKEPLISLVGEVMPVFMAGIGVFGIQMACQSAFMGMGQAKISLFLALLRKVILLIPLAIILPHFFGVMGIYWAEPIADIVSALTAGTLFWLNFNKIMEKNVS